LYIDVILSVFVHGLIQPRDLSLVCWTSFWF